MFVHISSFSDFRHLQQLIDVSEIGNLRVSDHVNVIFRPYGRKNTSQNGYFPSLRTEDCATTRYFPSIRTKEWPAKALSFVRMDRTLRIRCYFLSAESRLWYIWQSWQYVLFAFMYIY